MAAEEPRQGEVKPAVALVMEVVEVVVMMVVAAVEPEMVALVIVDLVVAPRVSAMISAQSRRVRIHSQHLLAELQGLMSSSCRRTP